MHVHSNLIDILAWSINLFGPLTLYSIGIIIRRAEKPSLLWSLAWLWTSLSYTILVTPVWINAYHSMDDIDTAPTVFGLLLLYYAVMIIWFFLTYVMHAWSFLSYFCILISTILAIAAASVSVFTFPGPHAWHYLLYTLVVGPLLCLFAREWEAHYSSLVDGIQHQPGNQISNQLPNNIKPSPQASNEQTVDIQQAKKTITGITISLPTSNQSIGAIYHGKSRN